MMTVRFPNGTFVSYNNATQARYESYGWVLYTKDPKEGGVWIASIQPSAGAVLEAHEPCRMGTINGQEALRHVADHLRDYMDYSSRDLLGKIKRGLLGFNARTERWTSKK